MASAITQVDSACRIVTPENIAFEYQLAGPLRRLPAYILDLVVRMLFFAFVSVGLTFLGALTLGSTGALIGLMILFLLWFALEWLYGGLFETFWNGQTPGKRAFGLRVLSTSGEPINILQGVMRNFLRLLDFMPVVPPAAVMIVFGFDPNEPPPEAMVLLAMSQLLFTSVPALLVPAMNQKWQRVGDLVCGTMVVVEERSWLHGVVRLEDPQVAELAAELPHLPLARSTAKAVAMYVERRRFFSPPRRQEIAMHLGQALIERFKLPAVSDQDLLLCAVYYKAFVSQRTEEADRELRPARPAPVRTPEIVFLEPTGRRS